MHPGDFPDLDARQEAAAFFQEMYGLDEAAVEEHLLPRLQGDVP